MVLQRYLAIHATISRLTEKESDQPSISCLGVAPEYVSITQVLILDRATERYNQIILAHKALKTLRFFNLLFSHFSTIIYTLETGNLLWLPPIEEAECNGIQSSVPFCFSSTSNVSICGCTRNPNSIPWYYFYACLIRWHFVVYINQNLGKKQWRRR